MNREASVMQTLTGRMISRKAFMKKRKPVLQGR